MQFSPDAFNRLLGADGQIGQQYMWYRAEACPCIDRHSGAPNTACALCYGKGRIFGVGQLGVAGMAGAKTQREWAQFGVYEKGDVVVTIPENSPLYDVGQYDRVTALNSSIRFSLVLRRGGGVKERLLFEPETIQRVFWIAPDGVTLVDGSIPTVGADGTPVWGDSGAPPTGGAYTITGTKLLDYMCYGPFPTSRNMNQGARLPRRVVLRDSDVFDR
jgi:hypothetical protein